MSEFNNKARKVVQIFGYPHILIRVLCLAKFQVLEVQLPYVNPWWVIICPSSKCGIDWS